MSLLYGKGLLRSFVSLFLLWLAVFVIVNVINSVYFPEYFMPYWFVPLWSLLAAFVFTVMNMPMYEYFWVKK